MPATDMQRKKYQLPSNIAQHVQLPSTQEVCKAITQMFAITPQAARVILVPAKDVSTVYVKEGRVLQQFKDTSPGVQIASPPPPKKKRE